MKKLITLFFCLTVIAGLGLSQSSVYMAKEGKASFISEASLEVIKAESNSVRGAINPVTREFGFSVKINSFEGFNSEIQRVHFLENYMDQTKYPQATFAGKLIESIPFDSVGTYSVRAKGILDIHGVQKERIIRGTLTIKQGEALLTTDFSVPISDHGISTPKVVKQKIAEQIKVYVNIAFVMSAKS